MTTNLTPKLIIDGKELPIKEDSITYKKKDEPMIAYVTYDSDKYSVVIEEDRIVEGTVYKSNDSETTSND